MSNKMEQRSTLDIADVAELARATPQILVRDLEILAKSKKPGHPDRLVLWAAVAYIKRVAAL
jgi:hypothetical protein